MPHAVKPTEAAATPTNTDSGPATSPNHNSDTMWIRALLGLVLDEGEERMKEGRRRRDAAFSFSSLPRLAHTSWSVVLGACWFVVVVV